mgnify:FL=1
MRALFALCRRRAMLCPCAIGGKMPNPFKSFFGFSEKYVLNETLPWLLLLLGATLLSVAPFLFLSQAPLMSDIEIASPAFPSAPRVNNMLLYLHVLLAIFPLALGPWLFNARLRKDKPRLHRFFGQIYVVTCLISAATSFPLALAHPSGTVPRIGFGFLALAWFGFTLLAYVRARQKDFPGHRVWMLRSYACTYAFVNVKIYGYLLQTVHPPPHPLLVKILQSCFSWMSNLLLVEVYLAATTYLGVYVGRKLFLKNLRPLPLRALALVALFSVSVWISHVYFPVDMGKYHVDVRNLVRDGAEAMPMMRP